MRLTNFTDYMIRKLSLLALLVIPNVALASAGAEHHEATVGSLLFPAINFVLYCIAMYMILKRPISEQLDARREIIRSKIESASREKEAALKKLLEAQRQFNTLDTQISEMATRMESEAQKEATSIIKDAQDKAMAIAKRAKDTAEAERKASEVTLRAELADTVLELAKQKLKAKMTGEMDKALRERAIDGIQAIH